MDKLKLEERIKNQIGINCSLVEICENDRRCIVSDGTYEYFVTTSSQIENKLTRYSMTIDSLIRNINLECSHNVLVKDILLKKNAQIKLLLIHVPTGKTYIRWYIKKEIKSICRNIDKNATMDSTIQRNSINKFGDKFTFDKFVYQGSEKKSIITCSVHGDFEVSPNSFLNQNRHGCPECGKDARGGFSKSTFVNSCINDVGYIYILECNNENESFIKIGVSSKENLKERFGKVAYIPYDYKVILQKPSNPEFVFNLEHEVHRALKQNKYVPLLSFHGYTECFDISIKQKAISLIEELFVSLP